MVKEVDYKVWKITEVPGFKLSERDLFPNKSNFQATADVAYFDGYSTWLHGDGSEFHFANGFTLMLEIAPHSYEGEQSGLFSWFEVSRKLGLAISVKKNGIVSVIYGNGQELFVFESINAHLRENQWNLLSFVFRFDSGWSDLYINGQISNRKQFPKKSSIRFPNQECYIGKFVDYGEYLTTTKKGVFHGYMKNVILYKAELSSEELTKSFVAENSHLNLPESRNDRKLYELDVQRPQYHLIAPGKWMNETHGPIFYQGKYHIFYQANPHAPLWDHIQWGHFISEDMVFWKDRRLALQIDAFGIDPDGCWSGSGCLDEEGNPVIYYTAGNNKKFPNQSVARAVPDFSYGNELEYWIKDSQVMIEQREGEGWLGEFRDPFVWREGQQWFMLIGTGDASYGGGNALVYTSSDGKNWDSKGFIMDYSYQLNVEVGHVWELPVLLPLKDELGVIRCHILLLCACQIDHEVVETYYWLGKWDPLQCRFYKNHEKAYLIDLGNGTFTGPSGFVTPDGRSVLFTLAQGKRNPEVEFRAGWAHNGGLPLELSYKGQLQIKPIKELEKLDGQILLEGKNKSIEELNQELHKLKGNQFHLRMTTDADVVGIVTFGSENEKEVYYDKKKKRFSAREGSYNKEIGKYRSEIDDVVLQEDYYTLNYYLDHSMIEVYINDQKSITLRNYAESDCRWVQLNGDPNKRIKSFILWEMKSIY